MPVFRHATRDLRLTAPRGHGVQHPMAIAILGGLVISPVRDLVPVPALRQGRQDPRRGRGIGAGSRLRTVLRGRPRYRLAS